MNQTRRKNVMVARAHIIARYLHEAGIEASLGFLSVTSIGFRLNTARSKMDEIIEHFFMKWNDVINIQINTGESTRAMIIQFEPQKFPQEEDSS